jgi:UDP-2,3-diacylglucosamine pyrophosphatase LpxH
MAIRRLIISDLHFGSGDDLLRSPAAIERLEPELAWADELVINGDLLELVFASLEDAVGAARPFLSLVNRHVGRVHYILGNHDHHLVSLAGDERRFCDVLGMPGPAAFRVAPAERLIHSLCPDVDVISSYPLCELDGMRIMHGHYIAPHIRSSDWRLMDRLAWYLTGAATRTEQLTVADYESLIAPLYELMYEMANLPSGRRAQQRFERWLNGAASIARVPQRATRPLASVAQRYRRSARLLLDEHDTPTSQVLHAIQAVCRNLDVQPGTLVMGHTHVALVGASTLDRRHTVFNCGSWVWDRRARNRPTYREHGWPGTVLRATGGALELRALLADCDERDLAAMLGGHLAPPRRVLIPPRLAAAEQ